MKFSDLISTVSEKTGFKKDDISSVVKTTFQTISENIEGKEDEKLIVQGFGTFKGKVIPAKSGVCAGKEYSSSERPTIKLKYSKK